MTGLRAAKKGPEGVEKVVYGTRYACELPHVTLFANSPNSRFHTLGVGFIEGSDWLLASFNFRLQCRFSERFCINQQSAQPMTAVLQPVKVRSQSLPKGAV